MFIVFNKTAKKEQSNRASILARLDEIPNWLLAADDGDV